MEPPESIPNSDVKRSIADGSVGLPHVRVGHRQAFNKEIAPGTDVLGAFSLLDGMIYCVLHGICTLKGINDNPLF